MFKKKRITGRFKDGVMPLRKVLCLFAMLVIIFIPACNNLKGDNQSLEGLQIDLYKKLIVEKPDDIDLYYNLGTEYILDGRYNLAVKELLACLKRNYKYSKAYNNLGYAYYRLKDYESARKIFYKGTLVDSSNGTLLYNLGLAEFQTGYYIDSLKHFKMAKHYNPGLTERINELMLVIPQAGY